jgi:hypothetical protein
MEKKIKKYSWIHELNNAVIQNNMLNEAKKLSDEIDANFLTEEADDSNDPMPPEGRKHYEELRKQKIREKFKARNAKGPIKKKKVREPAIEGNFSFPTEVRDAHDFAQDLINQHKEYESSANPLDIQNHQELMSQFMQHTRSNPNLSQAGDLVKNYMGRYNLSRAQAKRKQDTLTDMEKADSFHNDLTRQIDSEIDKRRAAAGKAGTIHDIYRIISALGGGY